MLNHSINLRNKIKLLDACFLTDVQYNLDWTMNTFAKYQYGGLKTQKCFSDVLLFVFDSFKP